MSEGNANNEPPTSSKDKKNGDKDKDGEKPKPKLEKSVTVSLEIIKEDEQAAGASKEPPRSATRRPLMSVIRPRGRDPASGDYYDSILQIWPASKGHPKSTAGTAPPEGEYSIVVEPQPCTSSGLPMWDMPKTEKQYKHEEGKKSEGKEKKDDKGKGKGKGKGMGKGKKSRKIDGKGKKGPEGEGKDSKGPRDPEGPPPPPSSPQAGYEIDEMD